MKWAESVVSAQEKELFAFGFGAELVSRAKAGKKGDRTKAAILTAACDCLEQTSLANLTIADICDRAGIAHGTFYIYFNNRNALIADLLLQFSAFVQSKMRAASGADPDAPARAATTTYIQLFKANLGLMRCFLRHLDEFPEARTAFQDFNREWLEAVVASTENNFRKMGRGFDHDELMRRAYALGGMVDQYLAGLWLDNDPNMQAFSQNSDDVAETLNLLWDQGMKA